MVHAESDQPASVRFFGLRRASPTGEGEEASGYLVFSFLSFSRQLRVRPAANKRGPDGRVITGEKFSVATKRVREEERALAQRPTPFTPVFFLSATDFKVVLLSAMSTSDEIVSVYSNSIPLLGSVLASRFAGSASLDFSTPRTRRITR